METKTLLSTYTVVAHYQDDTPHSPKNEMEKDLVEKLRRMGFKPFQIRIMFERFMVGKLMLEIENALLTTQLNHQTTSYDKLMKVLTEKYYIDFRNDVRTNRMKGVKDLQKYIRYLKKNHINWTYLNVYDTSSKLKIGSLYVDEPIPKRMIE